MGVGYWLVNYSKREVIYFLHIPASTKRELAGSPVAAAITTWCLLENVGDDVAFVSDTFDDWPFPVGSKSDLATFSEVTERVVDQLLSEGILRDFGTLYSDPDEPNWVFERDLRNVWTFGEFS